MVADYMAKMFSMNNKSKSKVGNLHQRELRKFFDMTQVVSYGVKLGKKNQFF